MLFFRLISFGTAAVLCLTSFSIKTFAQADGFSGNGSFFYDSHDSVVAGAKSTSSDFDLAVGGGYLMSSGLYLGLKYLRDKAEVESGSSTNTILATSYGVTFGFMKRGVLALSASYLLSPTVEQSAATPFNTNQTAKQVLKDGTGTLLELGFPLPLNSSICLGPVLTQLSMNYKKVETTMDGITSTEGLTGEWADKWTRVALGVWFAL